MVAAKLTEADFTTQVIGLAKLCGWRVVHFRPALTGRGWRTALQGDKGFPDLCMVREGVLLFAELKVGRNTTTAEQDDWLADLRGCLDTVYVWTPDSWPEIERVLRGGP